MMGPVLARSKRPERQIMRSVTRLLSRKTTPTTPEFRPWSQRCPETAAHVRRSTPFPAEQASTFSAGFSRCRRSTLSKLCLLPCICIVGQSMHRCIAWRAMATHRVPQFARRARSTMPPGTLTARHCAMSLSTCLLVSDLSSRPFTTIPVGSMKLFTLPSRIQG